MQISEPLFALKLAQACASDSVFAFCRYKRIRGVKNLCFSQNSIINAVVYKGKDFVQLFKQNAFVVKLEVCILNSPFILRS